MEAANTTPNYWDGESALFLIDTDGDVHIQEISGFDIDEWFAEQTNA